MDKVWGDSQTKFFFELTPERILSAVESLGFQCTGRCLALNSMENRVYEVEIELPDDYRPKSPAERFRIVKFYRPGRWSKEQIQDEHQFLLELVEYEIPVVAPLLSESGQSLHTVPDIGIYFAVFPKVGGRSPDELDMEQAERIGRLLARMHNVGGTKKAAHRITLNCETYGRRNLELLLQGDSIPEELRDNYRAIAEQVISQSEPLFAGVAMQRIHGDCHLGNLLWGPEGPFFVDFDDMVMGPQVQDIWLVVPGRDEEAQSRRQALVTGYESMRDFDRRSLRLIEPLRALRFIHFAAWISSRWHDPAFPRNFPQFGSARYWQEQIQDLREQLGLIQESLWS